MDRGRMKRKAVRLMVNLRSVYQGLPLAPSGSLAITAITARGRRSECHARPLRLWPSGFGRVLRPPSKEQHAKRGQGLVWSTLYSFPSTPGTQAEEKDETWGRISLLSCWSPMMMRKAMQVPKV